MRWQHPTARPRESGYLAWIPAYAGMSGGNSDFERRAADKILFAVEQNHFDGDIVARNNLRGGVLRSARDRVAETDAVRRGERKSLRRRVGRHDALAELRDGKALTTLDLG